MLYIKLCMADAKKCICASCFKDNTSNIILVYNYWVSVSLINRYHLNSDDNMCDKPCAKQLCTAVNPQKDYLFFIADKKTEAIVVTI